MNETNGEFQQNCDRLGKILGCKENYDVIFHRFQMAQHAAAIYVLQGFVDGEVFTEILQNLQALPEIEGEPAQFIQQRVGYYQTSVCPTLTQAADAVLAGQAILLLEGLTGALVLDARNYTARGPAEPDLEKVIRGSRDGFTETIVTNTQLIRRRIRDGNLRMEMHHVGRRSQTDVCLSYLADVANPQLVAEINKRLEAVDIDGLPMAEKSLEELITPGNVWNPLPRVRYTERPDVAAQHILEGHVVILVDTSPSVMILPATYFYHWQHAEEFRQAPSVGLYLRWVRYFAILTSLLLLPLWFAGAVDSGIDRDTVFSLSWQVILAELALDIIRLAAVHTPAALSTSLGLIAALMVGTIGVDLGYVTQEVVMYTAVAATTLFATPSYELGMAHRLGRWFLLFCAMIAGYWGVTAGFILLFILTARSRSFGEPYLWPLWPWDGHAMKEMLMRPPVPRQRYRPAIVHTENIRRQGSETMPEFHEMSGGKKPPQDV